MNNWESVVLGGARWSADCCDNLVWLKSMPDKCVDLVFFSCDYEDQRTYGIGCTDKGGRWIEKMRPKIVESCRISRGLVAVNMSSKVENGSYSAAVECLVADLIRLDGLICGPAPYAWVKSEDYDDAPGNGIPGSGAGHYHRRDWEPIYAFCLPGRQPGVNNNPTFWSDNTAYGRPPRYQPGGEMSNRMKDGQRVNDPWHQSGRVGQGGREPDGEIKTGFDVGDGVRPDGSAKAGTRKRKIFREAKDGTVKGNHAREIVSEKDGQPAIANPGNVLSDAVLAGDVLRVPVGGGKMGSNIAHEGEAPMAINVAERFACWYVPPGGIICDPFVGTGTTLEAALIHGRRGIGCDIRQSQVDKVSRRLAVVQPDLFAG